MENEQSNSKTRDPEWEMYRNISSEAFDLVDDVINKAIGHLEKEMKGRENTLESIKFDMSRSSTLIYDTDPNVKNIEWLSIANFSVDDAVKKINEFIQTWEFDQSWLYCIDFIKEEDLKYDWRYKFRVRWSIPTRRQPIPRASASVYFVFTKSKIKPEGYPVDVFYVFETQRLVHRPGKSKFREKWLKDIIESKVLMLEAVEF
ncbi:DgyrCDS3557 [Dimorphilus gyrociliatus]|uniref:DgyrCDS3557 n=1 Tax=Dimorphilus gyrociliatus TaxID=2664684 RepID=A0A7I8VE58_9ANNE|nr:DgyrCDS3557 [Dimorphilus gyrociliatus]